MSPIQQGGKQRRKPGGEHDALQAWRGIGAERAGESTASVVVPKRRSRHLLGSLLGPHKTVVAFMIFVVLVENGARLSVPYLVSLGIDKGVPPIMHGGAAGMLLAIVGVMLIAIAVQAVSRVAFLRVSGRVGQEVLLEIRRRVFRHFQRLDVQFHDRYTSGQMVSRLTNDVDAIMEMLGGGFDSLVRATLTLIGVGVMLLTLDLRLGIVCLLSFPLLAVLIRWFSVNSTRIFRKVREFSAMMTVQFVETMTGIRAVQAFRRKQRNSEIFEGLAGGYRDATITTFRFYAVFAPGVKLIGNLAIGAVVLYGGYLALQGDLTIGVLTAFVLYLRMFFDQMQDMGNFYNSFLSASSAMEKLSGVLEQKPAVREPTKPVAIQRARGEVGFGSVGFAYVEGHPVVSDLDLVIPAGQTVALVGATGAGKTTIAKLMARFYDPSGGRVTLDGIDLRDISDPDLRRNVVMVTQENFMFDGTVADNIGFGKPSATRDQIEASAKAVGAHELITALPDGYDTDVAKRGSRLSAGQRQLVAFARAVLANPSVLILDEATSSLDIPSERLVQQALQTILAGRTALIIAHRLSTAEVADRVLVLESGRIVEDGSPSDLLQAGGRYASMHDAWVKSLSRYVPGTPAY